MNRVAITGMGVISPVGQDIETVYANLRDGVCGVGRITRFDPADLARSMAGELCDALFSPRFETDVFERIDNMNPDSPQETNAID